VIGTSVSLNLVRLLKGPSSGVGWKAHNPSSRDRIEFLTPWDKIEHGELYFLYRISVSSSIPGVTATWSQLSIWGKELCSSYRVSSNIFKPIPEWFLRMLSILPLSPQARAFTSRPWKNYAALVSSFGAQSAAHKQLCSPRIWLSPVDTGSDSATENAQGNRKICSDFIFDSQCKKATIWQSHILYTWSQKKRKLSPPYIIIWQLISVNHWHHPFAT
jgi:hypothetical protein